MNLPADFDDWKTRTDLDEDERLGLSNPHDEIARLEDANERLAALLDEARATNEDLRRRLYDLKAEIAEALKRAVVMLSRLIR